MYIYINIYIYTYIYIVIYCRSRFIMIYPHDIPMIQPGGVRP